MRSAAQLPPGRHGLSRDEVRASQRERMLAGMVGAVSQHGYVRTSVNDVISRAGVSRETFYEQFGNKEECFLAAFDDAVEKLIRHMAVPAAASGSGGPLERFSAGLRVYLDVLAREQALARTFLIEVYAAGAAARRRRAAVQQRFVEFLAAGMDASTAEERFACEVLVSASSSMVTMRLATDDPDALRELHEPVMRIARLLFAANR
jgi:AcrR family transcriptional regulator